jgi:hypothetical protein
MILKWYQNHIYLFLKLGLNIHLDDLLFSKIKFLKIICWIYHITWILSLFSNQKFLFLWVEYNYEISNFICSYIIYSKSYLIFLLNLKTLSYLLTLIKIMFNLFFLMISIQIQKKSFDLIFQMFIIRFMKIISIGE